MKTRIIHLPALAIFALIIFAGNVNANENKAKASSHEAIVETSLTIENWMTDANVWTINSALNSLNEADAELEMESWMTDEKTWKVAHSELVENEGQLSLENWMINSSYWKI